MMIHYITLHFSMMVHYILYDDTLLSMMRRVTELNSRVFPMMIRVTRSDDPPTHLPNANRFIRLIQS